MPRVYKFYSNPTRFSDDFSILGERKETKVAFAKSQRDAQPMQSLHVVSVYVCGWLRSGGRVRAKTHQHGSLVRLNFGVGLALVCFGML